MARATNNNLLSLDHFARIMGINPVHFQGAYADTKWTRGGTCGELWLQHDWQSKSDSMSREEIADIILMCEEEINHYLGYNVAPQWTVQEVHEFPRHFDRRTLRLHGDVRGEVPNIILNRRKVIASGRRAVTAVELASSVVYSDEDGDGWSETATITAATALTDENEIKLFFAGHSGDPSFEIRPLKSVAIAGGTVTILVNSWQLIDPDLWEVFPDDSTDMSITIEGTGNFVSTVDIYRVYTDFTAASCTFLWRSECTVCGGTGCAACELVEQDGCLAIVDAQAGIVKPSPATYDEDDAQWYGASWASGTRPEMIKSWYYSGEISQKYLAGWSREALSDTWAQAIAYMAVSRMPKRLCSCPVVQEKAKQMQEDLLLNRRDTGARFFPASSALQQNPFGFHYGELFAWNVVQREMKGL